MTEWGWSDEVNERLERSLASRSIIPKQHEDDIRAALKRIEELEYELEMAHRDNGVECGDYQRRLFKLREGYNQIVSYLGSVTIVQPMIFHDIGRLVSEALKADDEAAKGGPS